MTEEIMINTLLNNNSFIDELSFLESRHFLKENKTFERLKSLYNEKDSVSQIDLLLEGFEITTADEFLKDDLIVKAKKLFDGYNVNLIKRSVKRLSYKTIDETLSQMNKIIDAVEKNYEENLFTKPVNAMEVIRELKDIRRKPEHYGIMVKSLPTFNKITGGMLPTDLIGIYGKEKSTKTTLTHQIVLDVCIEQKISTAVFNFEMDKFQVEMKTMSMITGIDTNVLRNPKQNIISDSEFDKFSDMFVKKFEGSELYIEDSVLDEQQIYNKTKELIKRSNVKLVIIDYLMLIESFQKFGQRRDELNYLTRFFKRMAKKLNIIIILVSQANDSGMREAEAKGLSRDANYYFYVEALEVGQEVRIADEAYKAVEGDYVVINRGIRHGKGNRAFVTRFIDNKYREIDIKDKYTYGMEELPL